MFKKTILWIVAQRKTSEAAAGIRIVWHLVIYLPIYLSSPKSFVKSEKPGISQIPGLFIGLSIISQRN